MVFKGNSPFEYEETKSAALKWSPWIDVFLDMSDKRTGSFIHLAYSGGVMEQPSKTMTILRVIQSEYIKSINDTLKR